MESAATGDPSGPAAWKAADERRWSSLIVKSLLPTLLFAMSMLGIVPSAAKARDLGPGGSPPAGFSGLPGAPAPRLPLPAPGGPPPVPEPAND